MVEFAHISSHSLKYHGYKYIVSEFSTHPDYNYRCKCVSSRRPKVRLYTYSSTQILIFLVVNIVFYSCELVFLYAAEICTEVDTATAHASLFYNYTAQPNTGMGYPSSPYVLPETRVSTCCRSVFKT